jgi:2-polyprenyl-6-methoxyphenol hydroxylase-like FAD-dependent oxidoreductase
VVLGADGARSAVREASGLAARVTMVGLGSLRGVAERSTRGEVVREIWAAGGRRFGIAPLPHGRTYFYCSAPLGPWRDEVACDPRAWIDGWRSEIPEAAAILEAVADWSRVVYDELGEVVVRRWWRGPVVLLGDAAHAMTPDLGQGANSAMVDALVLVRLLAEAGARVEDAARAYERVRRRFVRRVQMAARQVCWLSSWSSAPGRALRRALLALNDASERVWPVGRRLAAGYNHAEERYFTAD